MTDGVTFAHMVSGSFARLCTYMTMLLLPRRMKTGSGTFVVSIFNLCATACHRADISARLPHAVVALRVACKFAAAFFTVSCILKVLFGRGRVAPSQCDTQYFFFDATDCFSCFAGIFLPHRGADFGRAGYGGSCQVF